MKRLFRAGVLASACLLATALAGPRDAEWKQVDDALAHGLPKTASEKLAPIIRAALADGADAEAIKAIAQKVILDTAGQAQPLAARITRFQSEIDQAPARLHPVMQTILADWYWRYFQQNRWRFLQRTQAATPAGPEIETWDLARILEEIDRRFTDALANAAELKRIPIDAYGALLEKGTIGDKYRPTLFDFVANEALRFYQAGEHALQVGEAEFELPADGPIFGPVATFEAWRPATAETDSPTFKAVGLLQRLLAFHAHDADPSAYDDANLARLTFGYNNAVGDNKDQHYRRALDAFIEETQGHPISSHASALLAQDFLEAGEPTNAHLVAQRGLNAFPDSTGGAECYNLIQQIEAKSAELRTEFVWNAPWPTIDVSYRNITRLYFRAVAVDFASVVGNTEWGWRVDSADLLGRRPALEWANDLPPTRDYQQRTEHLPVPTSLRAGFYVILASADPGFHDANNLLDTVPVWVSQLALILRAGGASGGIVCNAITGQPVAHAAIHLWQRDGNRWTEAAPTETDEDGEFHFTGDPKPVIIMAESGDQRVSSLSDFFPYRGPVDDAPHDSVVLFTDRSLYRPGQAINYKGIAIRWNVSRSDYAVRSRRKVVVTFRDSNGKEVARATHQTNDYGSFAGVFTAPRDRLAGRMTLVVENGGGTTAFNVEEYKRPKFQVELNAPVAAPKLGATIALAGKAVSYTGAAITSGKVTWRVERSVKLPPWCWWWEPPTTKAIAHGTLVARPDGTFDLQFTAEPERSVPETNEPTFLYQVHVDVTDATGETRSTERTVRAGYTVLQASITVDEWQTTTAPVKWRVRTQSLDGDPEKATGRVTVQELRQPATVHRAALAGERFEPWRARRGEPTDDPALPDTWEPARTVATLPFTTSDTGEQEVTLALPTGVFRALVETHDRFGRRVTARATTFVVDPNEARFAIHVPNRVSAPRWSAEPGETFRALWGTGYATGRALVEIEWGGKQLAHYWTPVGRTQVLIEQRVTPEMRGGFTLRVTYVRENRAYVVEQVVQVPWTDKHLAVSWETLRSKLTPGQKETWSVAIKSPDGKGVPAELAAALYDASLDQYLPHEWPESFGVFRREASRVNSSFQNDERTFQTIARWDSPTLKPAEWQYRSFGPLIEPDDVVVLSPFEISHGGASRYRGVQTLAGSRASLNPTAIPTLMDKASGMSVVTKQAFDVEGQARDTAAPPKPTAVALDQVSARRNLNETAFFFPQLRSEADGTVRLVFTMPEALTRWRFLGFAHDRELRSGLLSDTVVTSKDLMVEPNPPRFVREGDVIEFTVKVTNTTDAPQDGQVRLTFADAETGASVDAALGNRTAARAFTVPARQSRTYAWRIAVPDGMGFLTYKSVASSGKFSDGEEGYVPVLSRRVLVTESLPLAIRGPRTRHFEFGKLLQSAGSSTLRQESLTVEMTSQPAWYAVLALPYLIEFPYECSEQVFNRLYANALARHIVDTSPKIRRVFEQWRNTPALDSPLEKNADLKAVALEETPWLRGAEKESTARRNVGLLFDANRLDQETASALAKLGNRQRDDGTWAWFPGGSSSSYITLYIMTGFGRLRHLGAKVDLAPALTALAAMDTSMAAEYRDIQAQPHPADYVPGPLDALYLYGRSFFLADRPIASEHKAAVEFFLDRARAHWLETNCRQSQGQLALALERFGDHATAVAIMKSLRERSVTNDELGMFWNDGSWNGWWWQAPIETQALMIEAFEEVTHDAAAVEACKVWLLKQKQTRDWGTTKATADATYALLGRGVNLLASDGRVAVALGDQPIKPQHVEAGTGYFAQRFVRDEIKPEMGHITVTKSDAGVSWGAVHWQYLEDLARITPHEGTPLKLEKSFFVTETTAKGPVLKPLNGPVSVGDELVVRLVVRTDRDMEFVHLKDQRASGTEPVDVLSAYRYQDGFGYYETTRDTATHFFFDRLPKGVHVLEYSTRVQLKGRYESGVAEIECMYAPEFNSHSGSATIQVK